MRRRIMGRLGIRQWPAAFAATGWLLTLGGCSTGVTQTGESNSSPSGEENVLLTEALSFEGSLSGTVDDSASTRDGSEDLSSAQTLPLDFDTSVAVVWFRDLVGAKLLDANGLEIPPVGLNSDGTFAADGLPVGTDFTVCIDVDNDTTCEIESCVNIPANETGTIGDLPDVQADPLTTLILAKLRDLMEEHGIDPSELPISPVAVVTRVVDAYIHLFEESGIDQELTLDDIEAVLRDELGQFFDDIIPAIVQSGMRIVEGNFGLAVARDAETVALRAAEVFLRAGFPIADFPGGPDFSALANLDDVEITTMDALFGGPPEEFDEFREEFSEEFASDFPDEFSDEFPDDFFPEITSSPAEFGDDEFEPVVYISTVMEPDRNFIGSEDDPEDFESGGGPVINDHVLVEMAALHLQRRQLRLSDLYQLLTSLEDGLGARLTFFLDDPGFFGPPLDVFETADGDGLALDLGRLFERIFAADFDDFVTPEEFERRDGELRGILADLLRGTIPPSFDRLFGGFSTDRIEGIDDMARRIREARVHLPFSRSGPSHWYVVADGDQFLQDGAVSPITVDADVSLDGDVPTVTYNAAGTGTFYLNFTHNTEPDGFVELMVRETGRPLHGPRGPVRLSMQNESIFAPINGRPFFEFVSETGVFYPGVSVPVLRGDFIPEHDDFERDGLATRETPDGPNEQLFVLATRPGPEGEPVRVDYDPATGQATYNPNGRNLLMFLPDSHETGLFGLFNEDTGRPAWEEDPLDFFHGPDEQPEEFGDFFNFVDDFSDFDEFEDFDHFDEFVDGVLEEFELDGELGENFITDFENEFIEEGDIIDDGDLIDVIDDGTVLDDGMSDGLEPVVEPAAVGDETNAEGEAVDDELTSIVEDVVDEFVDDLVDEFDEEFDVFDEEFDDGFESNFDGAFREPNPILIAPEEVIGLDLGREDFTHVFGTETPNPRYDPAGDPFFDDLNGNGVEDAGEPTSPFRPTLFDPRDWRSTDIRLYYRRADNNQAVGFEDVDWESDRPRTLDGVTVVPRNYLPRLNAFRFGRPNSAINLLTAFLPAEFFDGTHSLNRDTSVDIFTAIAVINLVMDQVFNVRASIDIDGLGPLPRRNMLIDAHLFVVPIGDPFQLLIRGFRDRSFEVRERG